MKLKSMIQNFSAAFAGLIVLCGVQTVSAQEPLGKCTVKVVDEGGQPVPGAAIIVKGTGAGDITDEGGICTLAEVASDAVIQVSCLGYDDVETSVSGRQVLRVVLEESSLYMEEVVVVGYGSQKRKDITGAVSSVKGDVLNEYSSFSAMGALQGRIAGVSVQQTDATPGGGISVTIRGANSIKGSSAPLWIINGFPGDINMINPQDIETIDVLKDASATAIYGSRGANGVILVTTKAAREGKVQVDYNGSVSVQTLIKKLDMANASEYMQYMNDKAEVNGTPLLYGPEDIANPAVDTDWQDEVFSPAVMTSHSLTVSGGTKKIQSSLSASYFYQDGIIKPADYQRYNISADLRYNATDWFTAFANVMVSRVDQNTTSSTGGSRAGSVVNATLIQLPIAPVYDENGDYANYQGYPADGMNPVEYLHKVKSGFLSDRTRTTLGLVFKPFDGFSINLSGNIAHASKRNDSYVPATYRTNPGTASISTSETQDFQANGTLNYEKTVGKHSFSIMGGISYEQHIGKTFNSGTATHFASDVFYVYNLNAAETKGLPTSSYNTWKLFSFLGRVNYNYDDRYLLTVNFRADGSSRFSRGNKWGYFPSAAAAWRISNESFLRDQKHWLSDLKLRVGYGITGSTAIDPYSTLEVLVPRQVVFDKDVYVGYTTEDTYPGNLKWEETTQYNVGLDAAFFDYRLKFAADFYYKRTDDLLCDVDFPRSSGYTTGVQNVGVVSNTGFEFQIDGRIIDRQVKWDAGLNFTLNRNKVLHLADGNDVLAPQVDNVLLRDNMHILREGEPMYMFYGYLEDGYDEDGRIVYKDISGEGGVPDGQITTADKTIIGNPNPDFLLNFHTSVSWKNFTLSAFLQGSFGNDIFSMSMVTLGYDYAYNFNVLRDVVYDHWTPENSDAKYPNLWTSASYQVSDRWVYDASYIRLKNLELSYSIPCSGSRVLRNAVVYVSGQNLFTITRYPLWDPDTSSYGASSSRPGIENNSYPSARSFTLGVRLGF